jgi:hypothetical protein
MGMPTSETAIEPAADLCPKEPAFALVLGHKHVYRELPKGNVLGRLSRIQSDIMIFDLDQPSLSP